MIFFSNGKIVQFEPTNISFLRLFYYQIVDILVMESVILLAFMYSDFNIALISQLAVIPVIIYLITAKYTKQVTKILIDVVNKRVQLTVNYFLIFNRHYDIPFAENRIEIKNRWLLLFYYESIVFKAKNKTIAVIPYTMSIWTKAELDMLKIALLDLAKEGKLNVIQSTNCKKQK